jgi:hypothetical protein
MADIKGDGEERDSVGMLSTVYDFAVGMIWGDVQNKVQVLYTCLPFQAQFQLRTPIHVQEPQVSFAVQEFGFAQDLNAPHKKLQEVPSTIALVWSSE